MRENIRILGMEEEDGELSKIMMEIGRDRFDEFVHQVRETLADEYPRTEPVIVREGKRNPMIKVGDGPKIYFQYNNDESEISLRLAGERAAESVKNVLDRSEGIDNIDSIMDDAWRSLSGGVEPPSEERGPTSRGYTEPEDYQGGVGDELESENGPDTYEGPEDDLEEMARERIQERKGGEFSGVEPFEDGSIRFKPRFSKEEAGYKEKTDRDFDRNHKRCGSCAHYIEGGGCKLVQGDIDNSEYCEELYADVGVFGHKHDEGVEENLIIWGEEFDWSIEDAKEFAMDMRERIESKIRNLSGR